MTRAEAERAIVAGAELVEDERARGADAIGTGEMGIGNTTAASAIVAALTGAAVDEVTGRGTGIERDAWRRKVSVIERALAINAPDPADALDVLAKVGGFEIAGLAGVILGGAGHRMPVFIDGFIAGAAALCAVGLAPHARDYLIASHRSVEPGHRPVLDALGLEPVSGPRHAPRRGNRRRARHRPRAGGGGDPARDGDVQVGGRLRSARMTRLAWLVLAALALLLGAAPARGLTVVDQGGHTLTLPGPPSRIVSLLPSATEILFAIGAQDRLAGVTDLCDYPAEARTKPSVGGMIAPSLEALVALKPDLVLATPSGNRQDTRDQLRRLGIPVYVVDATTVAGAIEVDRAAGRPDRPAARRRRRSWQASRAASRR